MSAGNSIWTPSRADEVADCLRQAVSARTTLRPRGGGTHLNSMPRSTAAITLDLRHLDRVVAYDPGDLTIVVEAGMPIGALQERLAENDHELALDVEDPARATIGGLLASDFPTRAGLFGHALRDQVIGTRVAQLDGSFSRSGGRVVKNVTGYDLDKLYIGSRGTLAILVEVALRVHPRARASRTVAAACSDIATAHALALKWRDPTPAALDVIDQRGAQVIFGDSHPIGADAPLVVLASWRGVESVAVAYSEQAVHQARDMGLSAMLIDGAASERAHAFAGAPRRMLGCTDASTVVALAARPSQANATWATLQRALNRSGLSAHARCFSSAAGLRVRACLPQSPAQAQFKVMLDALQQHALHSDARLHLEAAPAELHALIWSEPYRRLLPHAGGLPVMRRIKHGFDEHDLLHPGAWPMLAPLASEAPIA